MPALQIRLTDDQHAEIRERAEAVGLSMSEYVREAVTAGSADDTELLHAVGDHEQRVAELEARVAELLAWHGRSKAERAAWEKMGWRSPLSEEGYQPIPRLRPA